MKKLCSIMLVMLAMPLLSTEPQAPQRTETSRRKSASAALTLAFLFTCCPEASKQVIEYLLHDK